MLDAMKFSLDGCAGRSVRVGVRRTFVVLWEEFNMTVKVFISIVIRKELQKRTYKNRDEGESWFHSLQPRHLKRGWDAAGYSVTVVSAYVQ